MPSGNQMSFVTTSLLFCSGRLWLSWNSVPHASLWVSRNYRCLIERPYANRVELMMSRARAILVSFIPALFLLVSGDCLGDPISGRVCRDLGCLFSSGEHGKHNDPATANSSDQNVQRWNRRVNIRSGADGFASPATSAQWRFTTPRELQDSVKPSPVHLELAQCWQFYWRTALEPRAPSLVS